MKAPTGEAKYPVGIDFEWYAVDRTEQIARFTTGGRGFIPATALAPGNCYDVSGATFAALPERCAARLLVDFPKPDDFIAIAKAGLFAYDYRDGRYELVAIPSTPLHFGDMPDDAKRTVSMVRLSDVAFGVSTSLPEAIIGESCVGPSE